MLSCEVVTDLMSAYTSGEASAETKRLVEEHLRQCPSCREAFGGGESPSRLDEALQAAGGEVPSPQNGTRFLLRTRKRLFILVNGLLLLGMCGLALILGYGVGSIVGDAFPFLLPWQPPAWIALGAGLLVCHWLLVRWRTQRRPRQAGGEILLSALASLPLVVLGVAACDLLVAQNFIAGFMLMLLLASGVLVSYFSLERFPYATVMNAIGFILVICVLVCVTSASLISGLGVFSIEKELSFRRPPHPVTPGQDVRADLSSLGLMLRGTSSGERLGNFRLDSGETAAQAQYTGEDKEATITSVECRNTERAMDLFRQWAKETKSGVHILQVDENLPLSIGGGSVLRTYSAMWERTYIGWQNENWLTIIEVPGSLGESGKLAYRMKDLLAKRYPGLER